MLADLTTLPTLQMMQMHDVMRTDKHHEATEFMGHAVLGTFQLLVTFLLLPAVRRRSAGRERPSPLPEAQWPRCARHPATPPGECFPPASRNTARWGPAAATH